MDLGDRCGRDRGFVERREQRLERTGELGLDQRSRLASREWRQPILQARQIEGDLLAEEIGSGRQKLAKLDKARAQLPECRGEPLTGARRSDGTAAREGAAQPQQGSSGRDGVQRKERVVPRQGHTDPDQPGEVAGTPQQPELEVGARQRRQAEWSAATPPVRLRNLT